MPSSPIPTLYHYIFNAFWPVSHHAWRLAVITGVRAILSMPRLSIFVMVIIGLR
jgi:hypothetical protein